MNHVNFYFEGRARKKEGAYDAAYQAYRAAVAHGDAKGYYGIALLEEEGGAEEKALSALYANCYQAIRAQALREDPAAAAIVGIYHAMGLGGVAQDAEQAHLWFLIGALGGDEVAQFNLAVHYYLGVTVKENLPAAKKWLMLAMEHQYEPAFSLYEEIQKSKTPPASDEGE